MAPRKVTGREQSTNFKLPEKRESRRSNAPTEEAMVYVAAVAAEAENDITKMFRLYTLDLKQHALMSGIEDSMLSRHDVTDR